VSSADIQSQLWPLMELPQVWGQVWQCHRRRCLQMDGWDFY